VLPTGTSATIDGVVVVNGDRVLFTNLSSNNNRVYVVSGVGTALLWTLETDGKNGDGSPADGDLVYVQEGAASGDLTWGYTGTSWIKTNPISNADVISKVLTGFSASAGTVAASDTILQAFNKLVGNVGLKLDISALTDAAVTSKVLTGFSAGAGTVAATDTILSAFNKLDGNIATKQAAGNYITALTGDVTAIGPGSAAASIANSTVTGKTITGFSSTRGSITGSDTILSAINKLHGNFESVNSFYGYRYQTKRFFDFDSPTLQVVTNASNGSGASNSFTTVLPTGARPGVYTQISGTTSTGSAGVSSGDNLILDPAVAVTHTFVVGFRIPELSALNQDFHTVIGLSNTSFSGSTHATSGIFLDYDRLTYGDHDARWVVLHGGVSTIQAAGITIAAGTWYRATIVITTGSGSASVSMMLENMTDIIPGTACSATEASTGFPPNTQALRFGGGGIKRSGTASKQMSAFDYVLWDTNWLGVGNIR